MAHKQRTLETDVFGLPVNTISINSKNKGNSNERACAKYLSEWVGVKFVRVPMSGGLRRDDTDKTVGDIIPDTTDKTFYFPFTVETKHLKSIAHQRILRSSSAIFKIWEQPHSDSLRSGKLPMALLRSNHMPAGEYYLILDAAQGGSIMALNTPILFSGSNHKFSLIGFKLSDVKKHTPYNLFAKQVRRLVSKSKIYE